MEKELFTLYYINLEKVYELRTIRNNLIPEKRIVENQTNTDLKDNINAKLSAGIKGLLSSDVGANLNIDILKSIKVSDTFTVKQTKSNILSDILEMASKINDFSSVSDGDLVRLDNIKLNLENEQLIRLFKILSRDIIKGQVANGIDINNALNALAKDYSYLLSSTFGDKNIVIKIPISADGEFENKYSIDDLLIGNLCIIGVYKGIIKGSELNSTYDFFANLGSVDNQNNSTEEEIQSSSDEKAIQPYSLKITLNDNAEYIFIDLFSIFQHVKVKELSDSKLKPSKKTCFLKKLLRGNRK